ncbi:unnamed protein product [Hyaloperonospora brassicae]|uniref:Nucleotide-diphospho-sugar transferase n=1 Tax=Hyaloperonospora brassicae TaxID=162125 RepID=A0AAV0UUB6_HYABA|nr:unnamed protein product [Hyaloperonospora brassicae]
MSDALVRLSSLVRPKLLRLLLLATTAVYTIAMVTWVLSSRQSVATPADAAAEAHAATVERLPREALEMRQLRCIGWRATRNCSADGARDVAQDKRCDERVESTASGYCEVEDVVSGERFRVLQRGCRTVRKRAVFTCSRAPDVVAFRVESDRVVEAVRAPAFRLPRSRTPSTEARAGIVMVVYPSLLASVYALIRTLRELMHCQLPIEVWYRPDEMRDVPAGLKTLEDMAEKDAVGGLTIRAIDDLRAVRYATKVHAIYNSAFDHVLFLDADNVPVRDPTFLFESEEFVRTGAVFWPDFWLPQHTIFHVVEDSLVWQLLDMPYVDMFEQESGQLVIDRRRHAAATELVHFYALHTSNLFEQLDLAWGDKDLFRFAWIKLNAPFFMVQTPPAVAGKLVGDSFCGMTMVQHDASGRVLFLHRNANKLTGRPHQHDEKHQSEQQKQVGSTQPDPDRAVVPEDAIAHANANTSAQTPLATLERASESDELSDPAMWTHLWSFRNSSPRDDYRVTTYKAPPGFPSWQGCYGPRNFRYNEHFYAQEFASLDFSGLETHLRRFAMEGAQLVDTFRAPMAKETR